ncbi:hypothetical protein [Variovorax paradoxus]|jgi:hypothetical protein|uniref:Lipoprotein n=1 Tax=Variovorax paradoxus TaxID=34073 RepID=A0A679J7K2_VARPD|nr:hypothetical protein VVAX_05915 [Variovorax paradoxus]
MVLRQALSLLAILSAVGCSSPQQADSFFAPDGARTIVEVKYRLDDVNELSECLYNGFSGASERGALPQQSSQTRRGYGFRVVLSYGDRPYLRAEVGADGVLTVSRSNFAGFSGFAAGTAAVDRCKMRFARE